jgi:subtilisin family serine protease
VASFSGGAVIHHENHAFTVPAVVAPGVDVYSCVPAGAYVHQDGTSMATPLVSGVAALLCERYPRATPHDIMDAILSTCSKLDCDRERQGHGMVDAEKALAYLA